MEGQPRCQVIETGPVKHICGRRKKAVSHHSNRVMIHSIIMVMMLMMLRKCHFFQFCVQNKQKCIDLHCFGVVAEVSVAQIKTPQEIKPKQYPSLDMTRAK